MAAAGTIDRTTGSNADGVGGVRARAEFLGFVTQTSFPQGCRPAEVGKASSLSVNDLLSLRMAQPALAGSSDPFDRLRRRRN
jgi:hypothetical protein